MFFIKNSIEMLGLRFIHRTEDSEWRQEIGHFTVIDLFSSILSEKVLIESTNNAIESIKRRLFSRNSNRSWKFLETAIIYTGFTYLNAIKMLHVK